MAGNSAWKIPGAVLITLVVYAFMQMFNVPRPAAWYLDVAICAGLMAVHFSRRTLIEKTATYVMFAVVATVGSMLTFTDCSGGLYLLSLPAGYWAWRVVHFAARRLGWEKSLFASDSEQSDQHFNSGYFAGEFYTSLSNTGPEKPKAWP